MQDRIEINLVGQLEQGYLDGKGVADPKFNSNSTPGERE